MILSFIYRFNIYIYIIYIDNIYILYIVCKLEKRKKKKMITECCTN